MQCATTIQLSCVNGAWSWGWPNKDDNPPQYAVHTDGGRRRRGWWRQRRKRGLENGSKIPIPFLTRAEPAAFLQFKFIAAYGGREIMTDNTMQMFLGLI